MQSFQHKKFHVAPVEPSSNYCLRKTEQNWAVGMDTRRSLSHVDIIPELFDN